VGNRECNSKRGSIEQLYIALGHIQKENLLISYSITNDQSNDFLRKKQRLKRELFTLVKKKALKTKIEIFM